MQVLLVLFYLAVVHALQIPVQAWDLAVIVPLSFVVQMLPISINGFGVREATFSFYFTRMGLTMDSGVLLSLVATALVVSLALLVESFGRDVAWLWQHRTVPAPAHLPTC